MSITTRFPFAPAILSFILTLVCTTTAFAQSVPVNAGDRVRVVTQAGETTLVVDSVQGDGFVGRGRANRTVRVYFETIETLYVSRGPAPRGASALKYGGTGFLTGALIGTVLGLTAGDDPPDHLDPLTARDKAVWIGLGLGTSGLVIGAVGGLIARVDRWEPIFEDTRIGMGRHGGLSLGYEIRF